MIYHNELIISKSTNDRLLEQFHKNYENILRVERVFISLFFNLYPKKKKITKRRYLF